MKLTKEQKRAIEKDAENAAREGKQPQDACPWPYPSEEGMQWLATWAVAYTNRDDWK